VTWPPPPSSPPPPAAATLPGYEPATVIALRASPPVSQTPAPVVISQPVAAKMQGERKRHNPKTCGDLKWPPNVDPAPIPETLAFEVPIAYIEPSVAVTGGVHARGDAKWPPPEYKTRAEMENAARIALAKGPTCRPRRVNRDYSSFFAQHALNDTYPGYRAPPGTQHYLEESGTSDL